MRQLLLVSQCNSPQLEGPWEPPEGTPHQTIVTPPQTTFPITHSPDFSSIIILFSSPHISQVHPITRCKVLYVVALHFWAFPLVSFSLGSWIFAFLLDSLFASEPCVCLFICVFGLPSRVWLFVFDYESGLL